jgi:DNA-binding NtrC family response regulator
MDDISIESGEMIKTFLGTFLSEDKSIQSALTEPQLKVTMVDDDHAIEERKAESCTFKSFLQRKIAGAAIQAMNIVETESNISIIISDFRMPDIDGRTTAQHPRARKIIIEIPRR